MTRELVRTATLVTDAGATVEWLVLEQHIAALAHAEPGFAAHVTAHRPGQEEALTAVQVLPLSDGRLEVNLSYGTRGARYQRVKPAGSSARIQGLLVRPGWAARIQEGAILIPAQAPDATAWACAEGSLVGPVPRDLVHAPYCPVAPDRFPRPAPRSPQPSRRTVPRSARPVRLTPCPRS